MSFLSSEPTDMRKGCNGLSCIIRERMQLNHLDYSNAHAPDDHGRADKTINMKIWQRKQTYKTHLR